MQGVRVVDIRARSLPTSSTADHTLAAMISGFDAGFVLYDIRTPWTQNNACVGETPNLMPVGVEIFQLLWDLGVVLVVMSNSFCWFVLGQDSHDLRYLRYRSCRQSLQSTSRD